MNYHFKKKISQYLKSQSLKFRVQGSLGISFIDVLVGTALVLIVFLGIFGAYQLGLKVVGYSKNKITATALANHELEMVRNLSYGSVGIIGGVLPTPEGILESSASTFLNGIEYTIERRIEYVSDATDGLGASDDCDLDYKTIEIKVSWSGRFRGEVKLSTDVAPKNKVEELAACEAQPGGILSVEVFDAFGILVSSPLIEVFDSTTEALIISHMPDSGEKDIPLATGIYKIIISKASYNTARSYGTDEVANPTNDCYARPHQEVLEGQLTPVSFCIDDVSSFLVNTLSLWGSGNFTDYFGDETKISEKSNVTISGGEVNLADSGGGYFNSGYLFSTAIIPETLNSWDSFSFGDLEPLNTDLKYQLFYFSDPDWDLIPNLDLPGNSEGLGSSPVDLSGLDIGTYSQIKIKGIFSTLDTSFTPTLYDWQLSWKTSDPTSVPFADFNLRGEKTIGTDAEEQPVYKYSLNTNSDASGQKNIPDLEWDLYTFSTEGTGLALMSIEPAPQPVNLLPETNQTVNLYLKAENSLLVTVQNTETAEPVFGASVRLYHSGLGYDSTQYTNEGGQTYFIPLEENTYNLDVEASAYLPDSGTVWVSGDVTKIIGIEQVE